MDRTLKIWRKTGGFDEVMFIDEVDFEYCRRVVKNGYKIIVANKVLVLHEIGHIMVRRFLFWKINVMNHSAFRKYYMVRNKLYSERKHRKRIRFINYMRILKIALTIILYEDDKAKKLRSVAIGFKDGRKMKPQPEHITDIEYSKIQAIKFIQ